MRPAWPLRWLTTAALLVASVAALYPVLWVVVMAFSPGQTWPGGAWPAWTDPTLDQFRDLVRMGFVGALLRSLAVSGATAVVGLVVSTTAAWALARFDFPGRDLTLGAFLATQVFPGVVMAVPLYLLLDALGLLDRLVGLVLVYAATSIPFSVWTLKGWIEALPKEIEEAAMMDGATRTQTFVHIVLPMLRPALAVTGLFSFLNAFNEFVLAATLLSDPRAFTLPVVLQRFVGDYGTEWGHFAAGSLVTSIPVVVLFYLLQGHLVAGLQQGAVKG